MIGIAAVFAVIFGSDVLQRLLISNGVPRRFHLEGPAVSNRLVLLGLMALATAGLLWLAFMNYRRTAAVRGRIGSAIAMTTLVVVFLASGLLNVAPPNVRRLQLHPNSPPAEHQETPLLIHAPLSIATPPPQSPTDKGQPTNDHRAT